MKTKDIYLNKPWLAHYPENVPPEVVAPEISVPELFDRMVEKYALLVGGMATHRYDLSSMIMLKDNHIWTAGDIPKVNNASNHFM